MFFSLVGTSFSYETSFGTHTQQTTSAWFKDQGVKMWRSGRGFGKVGALYAGTECVIESVRTVSARWRALSSSLTSSIRLSTEQRTTFGTLFLLALCLEASLHEILAREQH